MQTNKFTRENAAEMGRRGGQKTGIIKGFAWIKENDPERFKQIIKEREEKRVIISATVGALVGISVWYFGEWKLALLAGWDTFVILLVGMILYD